MHVPYFLGNEAVNSGLAWPSALGPGDKVGPIDVHDAKFPAEPDFAAIAFLWEMVELKEHLVVAERFSLVRLIGKGGMGSVWHARDSRLDMDCAIKFIEGDVAKLDELRVRFEREAKAAAALKSPHVVQVIDQGVWENIPFIAMELLDGEDLAHRIAVRRLDYVELSGIVGQVCRALSRAHQMGIIHRDLKPENIFIVRDDDREIAKILDFGIAKHMKGEISGSNTKTGTMMGTPYYMSPEQAQGTKTVDARSDLWSLAVIVFQCMCNQLPFESEALGDLLVKIIVAPVPVPSQLVGGLPPGFDQWWFRAASRDPEMRFQNAREFGETLAMALGVATPEDTTGMMRRAIPPQLHTPTLQVGSVGAPISDSRLRTAGMPTPQPQTHPMPYHDGAYRPPPREHVSSGQVHVGPVSMPTFAGTDVSNYLPQKRNPLIVLGGIGAVLTFAVVAGLIYTKKFHRNVGPAAYSRDDVTTAPHLPSVPDLPATSATGAMGLGTMPSTVVGTASAPASAFAPLIHRDQPPSTHEATAHELGSPATTGSGTAAVRVVPVAPKGSAQKNPALGF